MGDNKTEPSPYYSHLFPFELSFASVCCYVRAGSAHLTCLLKYCCGPKDSMVIAVRASHLVLWTT